jgi:class 3 adenylate cyclase
VSDVVRKLAAGEGFLFSDIGEVALRGFDDRVRLYGVRWEKG